MNDLCNRYSLDTISTSSVLAFAFECFEKGLITTADTGGLELRWGDGDAIIAVRSSGWGLRDLRLSFARRPRAAGASRSN
jgi:aldehyde:ferredoxin oxidoreductase